MCVLISINRYIYDWRWYDSSIFLWHQFPIVLNSFTQCFWTQYSVKTCPIKKYKEPKGTNRYYYPFDVYTIRRYAISAVVMTTRNTNCIVPYFYFDWWNSDCLFLLSQYCNLSSVAYQQCYKLQNYSIIILFFVYGFNCLP